MKLQRPTDFLILEILAKKGRNVAPNIAMEIDKSRSHVNVRLPVLADYDLVQKVGPAENSGLYEITGKGKAVLNFRDEYDQVDDFGNLVDSFVSGDLSDETVNTYFEDNLRPEDIDGIE